MRLLLDECVPRPLKKEFAGHDVTTAREAGLAGLKNGHLLRAAEGKFDALLTVDQSIPYGLIGRGRILEDYPEADL